MRNKDLSTELTKTELYEDAWNTLTYQLGATNKRVIPIEEWVQGIHLVGSNFSFTDHEYQREILNTTAQRMCIRKGAQMGMTEAVILRILHKARFVKELKGILVLMPTVDSVIDYSKARFAPLIELNEQIGRFVSSTDSASLKRINEVFVFFRGGKVTSKIEGFKKSSTN